MRQLACRKGPAFVCCPCDAVDRCAGGDACRCARGGWVRILGGRISEVGAGAVRREAAEYLHDATARLAFEAAGSRRIALVTDAIAAAGVGDGAFQLGSATVVRQAEVRLADGERLAGSTLTMDVAVRRAVRMLGLPMTAAVEAASTTPARLLGIGDRVGSIEVGHQLTSSS